CELRKEFPVGDRCLRGCNRLCAALFSVIDVNKVDIRAIVEFASSQLSHCQNRETSISQMPGRVIIVRYTVTFHELVETDFVNGLDDCISKVRELCHRARYVLDSQNIASANA